MILKFKNGCWSIWIKVNRGLNKETCGQSTPYSEFWCSPAAYTTTNAGSFVRSQWYVVVSRYQLQKYHITLLVRVFKAQEKTFGLQYLVCVGL